MRKQSPFTILLLVLLLTASQVAMTAHQIGHNSGPDGSQQCPLCVSGNQPCDKPATPALPVLPEPENFHTSPAGGDHLQCNAFHHDQNPRAPPAIA